MRLLTSTALSTLLLASAGAAHAQLDSGHVADSVIDAQHQALAENTRVRASGRSRRGILRLLQAPICVYSIRPPLTLR